MESVFMLINVQIVPNEHTEEVVRGLKGRMNNSVKKWLRERPHNDNDNVLVYCWDLKCTTTANKPLSVRESS